LPEFWQSVGVDGMARDDETRRREARQRSLRADLTRVQGLLVDGYITEEQFVSKREVIAAELGGLEEAGGGGDVGRAVKLLGNLQEVWAGADAEGRATLARDVVTAVWCDLDAGVVTAAQLRPDLAPLLPALQKENRPVEEDGAVGVALVREP